MRDKKDKSTIDIFTLAKPVGRPRKHISNAAKQKLYRQRKQEELKNVNHSTQ